MEEMKSFFCIVSTAQSLPSVVGHPIELSYFLNLAFLLSEFNMVEKRKHHDDKDRL